MASVEKRSSWMSDTAKSLRPFVSRPACWESEHEAIITFFTELFGLNLRFSLICGRICGGHSRQQRPRYVVGKVENACGTKRQMTADGRPAKPKSAPSKPATPCHLQTRPLQITQRNPRRGKVPPQMRYERPFITTARRAERPGR
jgi:hypothetical protein